MRTGRRSVVGCLWNREGVAALELALIAPILLTITGGLADFGLVFGDKTQLAHAVASGAAYAFTAQEKASPTSQVQASKVQAVVQASTTLSGVSVPTPLVEVGCIQTDATASPPTTTLVAGTYGTPCPDGNPVGTYMVITAHYAYQPLMPFYSTLASQDLTASVTVRLY